MSKKGDDTKNLTEFDGLSIKKRAVIEAYVSNFGNITKSCKIAGITRATYYDWLKGDEAFAKAISEIDPSEMLLDFAEDALIKNIKAGSTPEILFVLKTKGKHRGYIEKIQTEDVTEKPKRYTINLNDSDAD